MRLGKPLTRAIFLLAIAAAPAFAVDDWRPVAQSQGVEAAYQPGGNIVRLRFHNGGKQPVEVSWKLGVRLGSGKTADHVGTLRLDAGATEVVDGGPYRDGGKPTEVKDVTGTIEVKGGR